MRFQFLFVIIYFFYKMNKHFFVLLLAFITVFNVTNAQRVRTNTHSPAKIRCSTMENDTRLRAEHPEMGTLADFEVWMQQKMAETLPSTDGVQTVYNIPVIVHVIHNGESVGSGSNISQAQINSQIDVLNEDYSRTNADAANTPTPFAAVAANCEIHFCLAAVDPQGVTLAQPGIHRVNRNTAGFNSPPYGNTTYIDNTIKTATSWDPTRYMNIWVLDLGSNLLGYAQFPSNSGLSGLNTNGGATNMDGVVIGYPYFGRVGNLSAPYDLGRTATHEVGHWLGLRHIDGDSNCGTDYVGDTPTQQTLNYGCPNYPHVTCNNGPNGDMFMNYMDYVDDGCMNTFTAGQKARMVTVMTNATLRASLNTSTVCNTTAVAPTASFTANPVNVCVGGQVQFTNTSIGNPTNYSWTFAGGTPATSTAQNPTVTYNTVGTYTVTLTVSNTLGSNTATQTSYIVVGGGGAIPISEGFEGATFVPAGWSLGVASPDTFDWKRSTVASGFGTSTACTSFDNFFGDNTSNPDGTRDELVLPRMNLTNVTSPQMTFDVAYGYVNVGGTDYADTLFVLLSTNCGTTWTQVYKKQGAGLQTAPPRTDPTTPFIPTSSQWRTETISLANYVGQSNVTIKFVNGSNWGDYLYLDNVNITGGTSSTVSASFTANNQTICAGNTVNFTSTSTGNPTNYTWSFTGGTPATSTAQSPTVTYATAGTYTVSLTASNSTSSNTATQNAYITVNALPTASYTPTVVAGNLTVSFNNTSTGGTSYAWTFGDGGTSTVMNPTHTYANPGTYQVVLTVTNSCGNQTFTQEVTVSTVGIDAAFFGNIRLFPNPANENFTIEIENLSINQATLVLYNVYGQNIWEKSFAISGRDMKETVDVSNLAAGTYLLEIRAAGRNAYNKLFITK